MRTKNFLKHLILGALLLTISRVVGQSTTPGNVAGATTDFLGWDNTFPTNNFPLMVRHDLNQPIDWYTNAIQRARLNPNVTGAIGPVNEFPGIVRDGFFLLSGQVDAFTNVGSRAPFTRLHLVDDVGAVLPLTYAQQHGFRPWQRNGITFTGNSDHGYVGQQYNGNDVTDMVIHWSDNPNTSPSGTDRLKFIFTTQFNAAAPRGAATLAGVEAMRFWPANALNVNVGIGDFAPPAIGDPTERLDMLSGNLRIRDLPLAANQATGPFQYMVVDDSPLGNAQRGVVRWAPLPVDCKWTLSGGVNNNDVWTAIGTGTNCPNYDNFVGIGTQTPWGKLHLKWTGPQETPNAYGLYDELDGDATGKTGGYFQVTGTGTSHIGVDALTQDALSDLDTEGNIAVRARALATAVGSSTHNRAVSASTRVSDNVSIGSNVGVDVISALSNGSLVGRNYGVRSWLWNNDDPLLGRNAAGSFWSWQPCSGRLSESIGVMAYAEGGVTNYGLIAYAPLIDPNCPGTTTSEAAVIMGTGVITNGPWGPSDEALKLNIASLAPDQANDILAQISVHTYEHNTEAYPAMGLAAGEQTGVIAQELEQVLPQLVRDMVNPAVEDRDGNVVQPATPYKAVNMLGFTPYLISGHQAQSQDIQALQELVAAQGAQLAQMQEALAACCANPASDQRMQLENGGLILGKDRDLIIQPNPFSEPPTVFYTLERAGRMQLVANSADGKQLSVLHEAAMEAGEYQLVWDTNALQPGMYYLTLLLDSEPVVKKAVKVGR